MHFIVKPAVTQRRAELTPAQRGSSLFSEAPTVLGRILRRGQSMTITEEQMKLNESQLKRLFDAHAIDIFRVEGGKEISLRDDKKAQDKMLEDVRQELKKEEAPPPEPPKAEEPPPPAPEEPAAAPEPEKAPEVKAEDPVPVADAVEVKPVSKKGRR